jgi:preprotein translocase subunit YajC
MGRNGAAFTRDGRLNIKRAEFRTDPRPLDDDCDCAACRRFSRGYIRHLFTVRDPRRDTRRVEPGLARALPHSTGTDRMITPPVASLLLVLAQAPAGGGSAMTGFVVQFVLIIAIIYFVMIRPQQKQRQKHEAALKALKKGDEVVTAGGIVGEVIHIRETSTEGGANRLDDRVTIKSGESRLVVERGRIARITSGTTTSSSKQIASSAE